MNSASGQRHVQANLPSKIHTVPNILSSKNVEENCSELKLINL